MNDNEWENDQFCKTCQIMSLRLINIARYVVVQFIFLRQLLDFI
jgi:hypothetical protein